MGRLVCAIVVRNPEDRFSRIEVHMDLHMIFWCSLAKAIPAPIHRIYGADVGMDRNLDLYSDGVAGYACLNS